MLEWRLLRGLGLALTLTAASHAATILEGSPFAQQTATAFQRIETLRTNSRTLASALEGTAVPPDEAQSELVRLPVNQPEMVALGQAGLAAALEAKQPGDGLGQIALASRMAGSDFGSHWMIVLGMVRARSPRAVSAAVTGLEASMLSQGWLRQPDAAAWLLELAEDSKDPAMADTLRSCAQRLDPVSPIPAFAAARSAFSRFDFQATYDAARNCLLKTLIYPQNQLLLALNMLRALKAIGLLAAFLAFLGWMVRYWPWIAHKGAEKLPQDSSIYLRYAVMGVGFLCLLLAGLGPYAFFLLGAYLLWKHLSKHERIYMGLLILFVGLQGALSTTEEILARNFDLSSPESMRLRSAEEGYSTQLTELLQAKPDAVAKSIQALKAGDVIEAESALQHGEQDPILSPLQSGNIAFVRTAYAAAGNAYSFALLSDPTNPVLPFNRGQVASANGHTDSLNTLLTSASLAGGMRFDLMASQNSRLFQELPPNRQIMAPELSPSETWARIGRTLADPAIWLAGNGSTGTFEIPLLLLPWISVGLLIFLLATSKPRNLARDLFKCKTCGRVMCRHCRRGLHCHTCFRRLSTVNEIELRNELLLRLEKEGHQRDQILLKGIDLIFPGAGSFARRPTFTALGRMLLLAASFALLLNLPGFITRFPFELSGPGKLPFLALLAILYGTNTAMILRRPTSPLAKG